MRITHVVRQFSPSVGGLEEAVLKLGGALQARGIAINLVTLDRIAQDPSLALPDAEMIAGLPIRRIPFRGSWRYPIAPSVLAHIAGADLVHVHGIDFFFDYLAATRPLHRKPLVASTHGGFFHTAFARRLKNLYFQTATRAAALAYEAVCASSPSDLALFSPVVAGRKLHLAVNGVDLDKWAGRASHSPCRHLLYIGRFAGNKHLPALFPVLRQLRAKHADWRLDIAGQPGEVTAEALSQEARAQGVGEAVRVLARPDTAAIATAVESASYIVSPSRHEGFGISIVEGLSAGLVPVVSGIPPFVAFVAEAGIGSVVDFDDIDTAATRIDQLHETVLADPEGARIACMTAARRYSWDGAADVVEALYANVLRSRTRAAPRPTP